MTYPAVQHGERTDRPRYSGPGPLSLVAAPILGWQASTNLPRKHSQVIEILELIGASKGAKRDRVRQWVRFILTGQLRLLRAIGEKRGRVSVSGTTLWSAREKARSSRASLPVPPG